MRWLLLSGVMAMCLFVACEGVTNVPKAPWESRQAEETAKTLRRTIREELKTLGSHEWAGTYRRRYLLDDVSLILSPRSGYLYEWYIDTGLLERNYGAVTWSQGKLRLSLTFPNQKGSAIAEELTPISWGDRRYLVRSDDIIGFCNAVNDGTEALGSYYLFREGDEKKAVNGFPDVPQEFRPYLLAHPIEATIIEVGKYTTRSGGDYRRDTPVTLDGGKATGLLKGMKLHVVQPENVGESAVRVTDVEEDRAEAVVTQSAGEMGGPQVGWELSTRRP